jgi:L-fuconolactonase
MIDRLELAMIDTHLHIADERTRPDGESFLSAAELVSMMDACSVRAAVLVPYIGIEDASIILDAAAAHPSRLRALVYVDWQRDDAVPRLRAVAGSIAGVRLETHARSPGRDELAVWRAAHDLGLRVSAQGGRSPRFWADHLAPVLAALPELAVRIEHLARPDPGAGVTSPSFRSVLRLSRYEHVTINVDGLWAVSGSGFPYRDVVPFVAAAIDAFGPDRVMWGSDLPYALEVHTYCEAQAEIRDVLGALATSADVARMLDTSAARFWGFDGLEQP